LYFLGGEENKLELKDLNII